MVVDAATLVAFNQAMAEETGAHPGALSALKRKLDRLDGLPFFHTEPSAGKRDAIDELYWRSIDRPKTAHWLAAYDLVRQTLTPHPASRSSGPRCRSS